MVRIVNWIIKVNFGKFFICKVSLAVLTSGLSSGWTSPYLAKFTSPNMNTSINLSETEASWVASLLNLGRFGGSIVGATSQGIISIRYLKQGSCLDKKSKNLSYLQKLFLFFSLDF